VEIVYGLTKPLNSHSFLWQHFHFSLEMYMNFKKTKWKVLFGKPDELDSRYRVMLERKFLSVVPSHRQPTAAITQYVTAQTRFFVVFAICFDII